MSFLDINAYLYKISNNKLLIGWCLTYGGVFDWDFNGLFLVYGF